MGVARLEDLAVKLFEINAFKFGDFTLKTGTKSPVYFDLRVIVSYPEVMVSNNQATTHNKPCRRKSNVKNLLDCRMPSLI